MVLQRTTKQKRSIKEYLQSVKTHPNAETVYQEVKKTLPAITLATVYRNLNRMADQGEIKRLEIQKEFRYDGEISDHQHRVCNSCGAITDVFQQGLSQH